MCFSSYNNRELKVKLWWIEARKRKKGAFLETFVLPEGNFFNICVLSQCIVYWINFQNICTFTYQKTLLHTFIFLFLKSSKAFSVILIKENFRVLLIKNVCKCNGKWVNCPKKKRVDTANKALWFSILESEDIGWWNLISYGLTPYGIIIKERLSKKCGKRNLEWASKRFIMYKVCWGDI